MDVDDTIHNLYLKMKALYEEEPRVRYLVVKIVPLISLLTLIWFIATYQTQEKHTDVFDNPELGAWTRFFDSSSDAGDVETLEAISRRYGFRCDEAVPCRYPLAMEIQLSNTHIQSYPKANLSEIIECMHLREDALDPLTGFYCLNEDQRALHSPIHKGKLKSSHHQGELESLHHQGELDDALQHCLKLCPHNGLSNCDKCANFRVRYFCLYGDYNCTKTPDGADEQHVQDDSNTGRPSIVLRSTLGHLMKKLQSENPNVKHKVTSDDEYHGEKIMQANRKDENLKIMHEKIDENAETETKFVPQQRPERNKLNLLKSYGEIFYRHTYRELRYEDEIKNWKLMGRLLVKLAWQYKEKDKHSNS